ncbi:MAG: protein-glutamate O-methyltransferase family protein [Anaerolineae bacterium]|nr:protein-glutamate O-methyltransferase family protein [Anaerolineae bacterium]
MDALPPPLTTSEPGSFAQSTIVERKPQIIREAGAAHPYPANIQAALCAFVDEIASDPIQPLHEIASDVAMWNAEWARYEGKTWLQVPWYFAETFFYRRLMEAVRFYQPGPWQNVDPFAPSKAAHLDSALPAFLSLLEQPAPPTPSAFASMLHHALWGNRADLSNPRVMAAFADQDGLSGQHAQRLLIDDTPPIWAHLTGGEPGRVDIVHDNCGLEFLLDLRLADFMLQTGIAREVRLHLKRMPFFVSDAMIRDLDHTLDRLSESSSQGATLALRLQRMIERGQLTVRDDPFWSTCFSFHQMPPRVREELAASCLVLFKGDVNYRRLLDDRHWPHTAHLAEIAADFPAPFAALRTLKGELIVDLQPGQAEAFAQQDPTWMINGKRGVIRFVNRMPSSDLD